MMSEKLTPKREHIIETLDNLKSYLAQNSKLMKLLKNIYHNFQDINYNYLFLINMYSFEMNRIKEVLNQKE